MPYSDGRIYARIVDGKRIGISTHDVSACLGVTSLDVGTLCRSAKINWKSRYRPVPYDTPPPSNIPEIMDRSQQSQGKYWDETVYVVRPWFYGRFGDENNAAIVAPSLDDNFDNIISSNGVVTASKRWKGNLPAPNTYAHLDQFHGYNDRAVLPWYGWINGGVDKGDIVQISRTTGKIRIGFDFATNDNDEPVGMRDGCWTAAEMFKVLGFNGPMVYVNVAIRNNGVNVYNDSARRYRYVSGTVKEINITNINMSDFDSTSQGFLMELDLGNASALNYGGIGQVVTNNDVLDVIVYLSDAFKSTNYHSQSIEGHSLFIDDESHAYKRFYVVEQAAANVWVNVQYSWNVSSNLSLVNGDEGAFSKTIYMRSGDNIYRCRYYKSGVGSPNLFITVSTTDANARYGSRKTRVSIGARYTFPNDTASNFNIYTSQRDVSASEWHSEQKFSWRPDGGITVYESASDAAAGNNPHDLLDYVVADLDNGGILLNPPGYIPMPEAVATIDDGGSAGQFYDFSDVGCYLHVDCRPLWNSVAVGETEIQHFTGKATYTGSQSLIQIYEE